jgi:hypothetical protein
VPWQAFPDWREAGELKYTLRTFGVRQTSRTLWKHLHYYIAGAENGMKMRSMFVWILAFFIVAFAAIYQRMTGPTYPVRGSVTIGGTGISFKLLRSSDAPGDQDIRVTVPDLKISGFIETRRHPSDDAWARGQLERQGDELVGRLPHQPPAGKVMYRIQLQDGANSAWMTAEPVVLRYKGVVPGFIMVPHIILMFLAMLFSTRAGFEAAMHRPQVLKMALWTILTLSAGGLILGCVVQKYAFGAFWTGWPFGQDLTDNKTLVAWFAWVFAIWRIRKRPDATGWAIAASVILFLVYMIPHSVLGSEIDYAKMPSGV